MASRTETNSTGATGRSWLITVGVVAAAMVFVLLYRTHPLFDQVSANVILIGVFFTLMIRLLVLIWAPILTAGRLRRGAEPTRRR